MGRERGEMANRSLFPRVASGGRAGVSVTQQIFTHSLHLPGTVPGARKQQQTRYKVLPFVEANKEAKCTCEIPINAMEKKIAGEGGRARD